MKTKWLKFCLDSRNVSVEEPQVLCEIGFPVVVLTEDSTKQLFFGQFFTTKLMKKPLPQIMTNFK